ncbi:zinc finger protein 629-like [Bradysia coprophila]|uniref:zinc finger protein 629-like n=1 Tax=Bradysia coprophila TaxID=38358 RepID=UPI00187D7D4B|nr:zinc finger protein 629-like [Bradysia coprophila]
MASILDISDTFLENFVDELSHPEHAAHPNVGFNIEEENMCKDLLDALNSLASPAISPFNVAANHVVGQNFSVLGYTNCDTDDISYIMEAKQAVPELTSQAVQNLDGLGYINYESGWSSSNIYCNVVGGSVMRAEQAAPDMSSCNFSWNDGGDAMQAEQEVPREITSKVCQNLDGLGCVNYDSGWSSSNIDCNVVGGSVMRAEQAAPDTSSCNFSWNDGGDAMQAEQEVPIEITSKECQNLDSLGYVNYDSGWSSSTVSEQIPPVLPSYVRPDPKKKNSANESNASETGAHTLKVQHCEPDVDVAIENHQMEEVLSHVRTATPVDSTEPSQLDKCQVQLIGKSSEIPPKNALKGRRKQSTRYPCAECGKQFSTKTCLATHSRVHTGERPYKCSQCDYASSAPSGLFKHRSVHTDARPFKCSFCDATFKLKSCLATHHKTHSEMECPHDICKRLFGGSLTDHSHR